MEGQSKEFPLGDRIIPVYQEGSGQRSKKWFLKRHLRWTASTISKLMSEGRIVAAKDGGNKELVWKWGDAAKTALFNKFYERLTGIMEKEIEPTPAMQRGLDLEPLSIERFGQLYPQYELIPPEDLVDTGFVLFPDDDGTREWEEGYKGENGSAGASADHLLIDPGKALSLNLKEKGLSSSILKGHCLVSGIETKSRGAEASNAHAYSPFDEKHPDWWQVVAGIHTFGVKYWYYLNFDDEKPEDWQLDAKKVPASPLHIKKMCRKIKDADALIDGYLKRCEGINAMMPDEKGMLLTEIREEIRNLKEMW